MLNEATRLEMEEWHDMVAAARQLVAATGSLEADMVSRQIRVDVRENELYLQRKLQ